MTFTVIFEHHWLILQFLSDREIGTSEDALINDLSTPLGYNDVSHSDYKISPCNDQTDNHFREALPPSQNSKTGILSTEVPKYLRRARRNIFELSDWITVREISGICPTPNGLYSNEEIIRETALVNKHIPISSLKTNVLVNRIKRKTAILCPKRSSIFKGCVRIRMNIGDRDYCGYK